MDTTKTLKQMEIRKIGPNGPRLIWYFGTELANNTQLGLGGAHVKANEV